MTTIDIEKRLTAIEQQLAELRAAGNARVTAAHPAAALEKIHGTFENDEAFREAARFGKKWRQAQDVKRGRRKAKRK